MNPIAFIAFVLGISTVHPEPAPPTPDRGTNTAQARPVDRSGKKPPGITKAMGSGDKN
jgi:hypothetical protein